MFSSGSVFRNKSDFEVKTFPIGNWISEILGVWGELATLSSHFYRTPCALQLSYLLRWDQRSRHTQVPPLPTISVSPRDSGPSCLDSCHIKCGKMSITCESHSLGNYDRKWACPLYPPSMIWRPSFSGSSCGPLQASELVAPPGVSYVYSLQTSGWSRVAHLRNTSSVIVTWTFELKEVLTLFLSGFLGLFKVFYSEVGADKSLWEQSRIVPFSWDTPVTVSISMLPALQSTWILGIPGTLRWVSKLVQVLPSA